MAEAEGGSRFALDVDVDVSVPSQEPMPAKQSTAREDADRKARQEEDAFNEAVASERVPVSRY